MGFLEFKRVSWHDLVPPHFQWWAILGCPILAVKTWALISKKASSFEKARRVTMTVTTRAIIPWTQTAQVRTYIHLSIITLTTVISVKQQSAHFFKKIGVCIFHFFFSFKSVNLKIFLKKYHAKIRIIYWNISGYFNPIFTKQKIWRIFWMKIIRIFFQTFL